MQDRDNITVTQRELTQEERLSVRKVRYEKIKTLFNAVKRDYILLALRILFDKYPFKFESGSYRYEHGIEMLEDYMDFDVIRATQDSGIVYVNYNPSENPNKSSEISMQIDPVVNEIRIVFNEKLYSLQMFEEILRPIFPDCKIYNPYEKDISVDAVSDRTGS